LVPIGIIRRCWVDDEFAGLSGGVLFGGSLEQSKYLWMKIF
jgi:hypothetical protein